MSLALLLAITLASASQTAPVSDRCRACPVPGSEVGCSSVGIACQPREPGEIAKRSSTLVPASPAAGPATSPAAVRPTPPPEEERALSLALLGLLGLAGLLGMLGLKRARRDP
ncbi:MAG: hypothetical protein M3Q52_10770 [Pseudomonadota bacterium]|nr:hypothetical protein [Pseudomonadota bacterium]